MNPGAVPFGLSSGRLPRGSSACLRLFGRIGRPSEAKTASICAAPARRAPSPRSSASQTASFVRSSTVGPRPPVVIDTVGALERAANRRCDPLAVIADCVRRANVDAGFRQALRDEWRVGVDELTEQQLRADRNELNARHRRRRTIADTRSARRPRKPRAASIIASRRTLEFSGRGCSACIAFSPLRQAFDEARKSFIHRALQAVLQRFADARREAGGRDRDAHRTGLRDRRHRDETIARLIDAAEQEAMAIGKRAQPRRERGVLRRRDDEERVDHVLVAQRLRDRSTRRTSAPDFAQRRLPFQSPRDRRPRR